MEIEEICEDAKFVFESLYECKRLLYCKNKVHYIDTKYCGIELKAGDRK